jgi:hypothetical protein
MMLQKLYHGQTEKTSPDLKSGEVFDSAESEIRGIFLPPFP